MGHSQSSEGYEGLYGAFAQSVRQHAERPALEVDGETWTYKQLNGRAQQISLKLNEYREERKEEPVSAVLGQRTASVFAGILGILHSGRAYVPMLPTFPWGRIEKMLHRSRACELLIDKGGEKHLAAILEHWLPGGEGRIGDEEGRIVLLDSTPEAHDLQRVISREDGVVLRITGKDDIDALNSEHVRSPQVEANDLAYILFTSGSTGQPKGVMVSHGNIRRFLEVVMERYQLTEQDRFTHLFDLTFDLSLFDLFAAWSCGGCLCCPSDRDRLLPARYVDESKISVWFSVPSTALLMKKTRTLNPGQFTGLRVSLFCGEALPSEVAKAWHEAAPQSLLENIYGPTELTLACTAFTCDTEVLATLDEGAVVPIGDAFPEMKIKIVDEGLVDVPVGESGELLMSGPQRSLGYWYDEERTKQAFVVPPGEQEIFYRTGDRVRKPSAEAPLEYLGRTDQQIKIRGYRVELGEVEAATRKVMNVDAVVAIGWPRTAGGADGIVVFVEEQEELDSSAIRKELEKSLPSYMLPRELRVIDAFPLNPNGKIDRNALLRRLDSPS